MYSNDNNENNNINSEEQEYMQEQQRKQQVTINEQMLTIGDMEAKVRTLENNARVLNRIIESKTNYEHEMKQVIESRDKDIFQLREQIKAHRITVDDQARKIDNMQRDIAYGKRLHEEETTRANKYAGDLIVMTNERNILQDKLSELEKNVSYYKQMMESGERVNAERNEQITALEEQVKYLRRVEMRFDALRDHAQSINGPLVEYGDEGEVEAQKPKRKVHIDFDAIDEDFDVEDDEDTDDVISRIIEELKERLEENADAEVIKQYDDEARRDALARHSIMELMTYVIDNDIDMLGHEFNSAALFKYDLIDAIVIDETSDDDE